MPQDPTEAALLKSIFFSFETDAKERVQAQGGRFVYYTNASTGLKVLRNREIWMRNATTMNDFMEVEHGMDCLVSAYESDTGRNFEAALDLCHEGVSTELRELFNGWMPGIRSDTFVTRISEHEASEDAYGRLSMWRAYGGKAGVAIVVNVGAIFGESSALGAYSSPVAYIDPSGFAAELQKMSEQIGHNHEFVRSLGREQTKQILFHALRFSAICTKHPAFREEREWRIVASPSTQASELLPQEVEDVAGVPQTVSKIKLKDHPEQGLHGLAPEALVDRVLIGPCEHPEVMAQAFRRTLAEIGVDQANERVHVTGVPLRF